MATRRSLYAYAMLQGAVEEGATSPVHAVVPLIIETIQSQSARIFTLEEAQKAVIADWGISIPINIIRFCLGRPDIKASIMYDAANSTYKLISPHISTMSQAEKAAKEKYSLIAREIGIAKGRLSSTSMPVDEIISKWLDVVADQATPANSPASMLTPDEAEANRIVALCMSSGERANVFKEAITDLAMGDLLYQSIVYASEFETLDPDADSTKVRMDRVAAYLDTGIIFSALGYIGSVPEQAARELFQMCRATGCKLYAFDHTIQETQDALLAFASRFYSGSGAYGPILDWALGAQMTKADLIAEADLVPDRLEILGVEIVPPPPLPQELSISETQLDYELEVGVKQENPIARERDVRSLAGIYRLRNGEPKEFLENCAAIFLTSNSSLARASTKYFNREYSLEGKKPGIQICMTDIIFSARLWTKLPTRSDLAPRHQILSKAMSYLRPNRQLRENFLSQLEKLVIRGIVSDEKAAYVKMTSFADRLLALEYEGKKRDITSNEAEEIVHGALKSFDTLVRRTAQSMAKAATDEAIASIRRNAEEQLSSLHSEAVEKAQEINRLQSHSDELQKQLEILENEHSLASSRIRRKAEALNILKSISQKVAVVIALAISICAFFQTQSPDSTLWKSAAPFLISVLAFATVGAFFPRDLFFSLYSKVALWIARRTT